MKSGSTPRGLVPFLVGGRSLNTLVMPKGELKLPLANPPLF